MTSNVTEQSKWQVLHCLIRVIRLHSAGEFRVWTEHVPSFLEDIERESRRIPAVSTWQYRKTFGHKVVQNIPHASPTNVFIYVGDSI